MVRLRRSRGLVALAATTALLATGGTAAAAPGSSAPIDVQVLAISDLHGYLAPAGGANGTVTGADGEPITAGGGAYLSTHLDQLSHGHPNSLRVSNGDNFTGWPWQVTFTRDEPTIEYLNHIGLDVSSVGNHELDISQQFLERMADGTCSGRVGVDTCFETSTGADFAGAQFPFLAANLTTQPRGDQPFAATHVETVTGEDGTHSAVGFIGVTTAEVERIFSSYQVGQLRGGPMLEAVDRAAADLTRQGVDAIVLLAHEGASHTSWYDDCAAPEGPIMDLARAASADIDVIVGGHWHSAFNCSVPDPAGDARPVLSPGHHGMIFGAIEFGIDPVSGDVLRDSIRAQNVPVTRDVPRDVAVDSMVQHWEELAGQMWARPVGMVAGDITADRDDLAESALGNLVADAYRDIGEDSTRGPVHLGLTHPYQVRTPISYTAGTNPADADGRVLFGEAWTVQGQASSIVTASVRGAVLREAFEQQWQVDSDGVETFNPLAVSAGVEVALDPTRARGDRVVSLTVDGQPVRDLRPYRVAMPSRLALGMDGFDALAENSRPDRSDMDYFAFTSWFEQQDVVPVPSTDRVDSTAPLN